MALSFSIFNRFKAIDGVTAPIRKMTKNVGKFGKTTVKAFRDSDRKASKFNKTLKRIFIAGTLIAGIALMQQGVRSITSQFIEFDDAIIAAGARFIDIGPDVDDFTKRIQGIKTAAREAGATTEFTAAQSAQAIDFMAKAGFTSTEAIGGLVSMINLATASGEEFSRVADISSDLLGAFGLNADNTSQKLKNLTRLNDVLVKAVNSANVTVETMFETMRQVGPIATGVLGASLEEVSALTMVLGSSGIKGTQAMTALKNAYLRLAAPTSKARKIMDALEITIDDGTGNARKMTDVMEELGGKISGLGEIPAAEILNELFGKRAIAGGKNLMDNVKNIKKFEKSLLGAGGTARKTAELMRTSLGNRLKTMNSSIAEFGFKILENFEIKGKKGLDVFTEAIRGIDIKPLVSAITILVAIFVLLYKTLSSIARFINEVVIKSIVDLHKMNSDIVPTIGIVVGILVGLKLAIMAISVAAGILTAIMAINPFTLFVIAAASVVLAIRTIIKNWDSLKNEFMNGLKWISKMHDKLGAFALLNPFTGIFYGIKQAIKHWDFLKNELSLGIEFISNKAEELWNSLKNIFASGITGSLDMVIGFGQRIVGVFSGIGEAIGDVFLDVNEFIGNIFSGIVNKFKTLTGGVVGKVAGFFGIGDDDEQQPQPQEVPISPQAGLANVIRQETETRSRVSVDFSNLPKGTKVDQTGKVPGFDLELGFAGA